MVNLEIPKNYTYSPSSYNHTPSVTYNHQATVDLDSSHAFEGPEKLLEVWFGASPFDLLGSSEPKGLKAVSSEIWKDMLDIVNCQVLSIVESEKVDAYLLSESSMFVFPHKLILKTCGTTTLLHGLPKILEIATVFGGFPPCPTPSPGVMSVAATPYRVFYSRKNLLHPDRQHGPHRSWRDEVRALDRLFHGGSAYMIGKMNGEHWYLYLTEPHTALTPPASPKEHHVGTKDLSVPSAIAAGKDPGLGNDETLEILMTDLDVENAKQFYLEHASAVAEGRYIQRTRNDHFDVFSNASSDNGDVISDDDSSLPAELTSEGHALGTVVTESCGLSDVYPTTKYPDARIDAYQFSPCGFSANGVIPEVGGSDGHYFTVHVTPEPHCSYASFETNVPSRQSGRETAEIISHVVDIFKPGRFTATFFETKSDFGDMSDMPGDSDMILELKALERETARRNSKIDCIKGYRRVDRIVHDLHGYDLVFRYYERDDWKGGAPRIGEHERSF